MTGARGEWAMVLVLLVLLVLLAKAALTCLLLDGRAESSGNGEEALVRRGAEGPGSPSAAQPGPETRKLSDAYERRLPFEEKTVLQDSVQCCTLRESAVVINIFVCPSRAWAPAAAPLAAAAAGVLVHLGPLDDALVEPAEEGRVLGVDLFARPDALGASPTARRGRGRLREGWRRRTGGREVSALIRQRQESQTGKTDHR